MALELENVAVKILAAQPRKAGSDQDATLWECLKLYLDLPSCDVLPYFHESLNGYLFSEEGLRFRGALDSIKWKSEMSNMEMELAGMTFQGVDLSGFKFEPYLDRGIEADTTELRNRVKLWMTASFPVDGGDTVGILAEMINRELDFSIKAMQMELPGL